LSNHENVFGFAVNLIRIEFDFYVLTPFSHFKITKKQIINNQISNKQITNNQITNNQISNNNFK